MIETFNQGEVDGGGRSHWISSVSSPEFEFNLNQSSLPSTQLLSADELFVDGVLLPLRLLSHQPKEGKPRNNYDRHLPRTNSDPSPTVASSTPVTPSKKWTDIFRLGSAEKENKKEETNIEKNRNRNRKKSGGVTPVVLTSEHININIWPFSRSWSAGSRSKSAKMTTAGRKVSSAPCSRSNSGSGTAGFRRWTGSSGNGIHVGRQSPVWQIRKKSRNSSFHVDLRKNATASVGVGVGGGNKARVLNLNVNSCLGYRRHMSCEGGRKNRFAGGERSVETVDLGDRHFNLRAFFFSKKLCTK